MEIKVYGPGCHKCKKLKENVINALAELDIAAEVDHIAEAIQYRDLDRKLFVS